MYSFIVAKFTCSLSLCLGQWTFCVYNWLIAREMPDFLGKIGMIPDYKKKHRYIGERGYYLINLIGVLSFALIYVAYASVSIA